MSLLEGKWIRVQKKTFTKWVNMHLAKKRVEVPDLLTAFQDGTQLAVLLNILTGHDFGKSIRPLDKIKMKIHKQENIQVCLDHIEKDKGVRLLNIGSVDIHDGNEKLILALVWLMILNLDVEELSAEQLNAKEALLIWCQKKTAGYQNVQVKNFSESWADGLAFCALIHKHKPGMLDFNSLDPKDDAGNLEKAFAAAEQLGIPRLLDVEDIVGDKPDEKSIMTYLFQWYRYFNAGNKGEAAARRIGKLINQTKAMDALKADYAARTGAWAQWTKQKTSDLDALTPENSMAGVKAAIGTFNNYKSVEKPPKAAEKIDLEALLNSIQLKLKNSGRPAYNPPDGHTAADIRALWEALLDAEKRRGADLKAELKRQRQLEDLVKRFNRLAAKLETEYRSQNDYLAKEEKIDSVNSAKARLQLHKGFFNAYEGLLAQLANAEGLAAKITALNYAEAASINARAAALRATSDGLKTGGDAKQKALEAALAREEQKNVLRKEYAGLAQAAKAFYKSKGLDIHTSGFGTTLQAVIDSRATIDADSAKVTGEANGQLSGVQAKDGELAAAGVRDNEYTAITTADVQNAHNDLLGKLAERDAAYAAALAAAQALEAKRKEFAAAAHDLEAFLSAQYAQIEAGTGSEDDKKAAAAAILNNPAAAAKLEALAALDADIKSRVTTSDNSHTKLSYDDLSRLTQSFTNRANNYISTCDENTSYAKRQAQADAERAARAKAEQEDANYAGEAQQLQAWISTVDDNIGDDLADLVTLDQVLSQEQQYQQSAGERPANQAKFDALTATANNMKGRGGDFGSNPIEGVSARFNATLESLDARVGALEQAKQKQGADDALRVAYVQAATALNDWLTASKAELAQDDGKLEDQLEAVSALRRRRNDEGVQKVKDVEAAQQALSGSGLNADDKTELTPEGLSREFETLGDAIKNKIGVIEAELAKQSEGKISPEQVAEYKELFEHFDRTKNGSLDHVEFKGVLTSVGQEPTEAEFLEIVKRVDSDGSGHIGFNEFINFMSTLNQDLDTEDEILKAFKVLTNDADVITEDQMRQVMDQEQVAYLTAHMAQVPGGYDYKNWTGTAFGK